MNQLNDKSGGFCLRMARSPRILATLFASLAFMVAIGSWAGSAALADSRTSDGSQAPKPRDASPVRAEELACPASATGGSRRLAHFIVYGRDGGHFAHLPPEMMSAREAAARKTAIELAASNRYGAGVKVSYGVIDRPGSCGFLYLEGPSDRTFGLAQGSREYLDKRRGDLLRVRGRLVTGIECPVETAPRYTPAAIAIDALDQKLGHWTAYGSSRDSACKAAEACLQGSVQAQGARIVSGSIGADALRGCDCEPAAGNMLRCTASGMVAPWKNGQEKRPAASGVRG
jgi:hypothetical protein